MDQKVQEIQFLEQNLQNLLMQKQAFQMELDETKSALKELESADDEAYKIIGQLMLKSDKNKIKDELSGKEKTLNTRVEKIEEQEKALNKRIDNLREEITKNSEKKEKDSEKNSNK